MAKPRPRRWMTHEQHRAFPDEIQVRETKTDHQILVTTMVEHRRIGKADLARMCARRWNVELDLRNIKTTIGMEVLHWQDSPHEREGAVVHLLAYHLIRLLMAQAASAASTDPRSLSFKRTAQLWTQWLARGLPASTDLFVVIAPSTVGHRSGRIEPRQRRPKPDPWLRKDCLLACTDVLLHGRPMRPKQAPLMRTQV